MSVSSSLIGLLRFRSFNANVEPPYEIPALFSIPEDLFYGFLLFWSGLMCFGCMIAL
jgi:hypothetical protein